MQKSHFLKRFLLLSGSLLCFSSAAPLALASGSFGGGSSLGFQNSYNAGKAAFHKKLACDTCPLGQQTIDQEKARQLVTQIDDQTPFANVLDAQERESVVLYLSKRYRLE